MLVSSIVSTPPGTAGEMTSPCTRRPADTFSPALAAAPKAASASLALSSPLPHRAQTEQQHPQRFGYPRDLAHPVQPSPRRSLCLALSFLVRTPGCVQPISRCREQRNYGKAKSCSLL
ncbi:unnamed protein product [Natator depressus]